MVAKSHARLHFLGALCGIVTVGLIFGCAGALVRSNIFNASNASPSSVSETALEKRILDAARKRRERKEGRMQRAQITGRLTQQVGESLPIKASLLSPVAEEATSLEVTLNVGEVRVQRLGISSPLNWPSRTFWDNQDWRSLEKQMQYGLLNGVIAYPHSPDIGALGNIIIAGHSSPPTFESQGSAFGTAFAALPDIRIGDTVEVRSADGTVNLYSVDATEIVHPTNTKILQQDTAKHALTLMTCYPVGTTRNRFVVHASLSSVELAMNQRKTP